MREGREGKEGRKEEVTLIRTRNPHLAGGEIRNYIVAPDMVPPYFQTIPIPPPVTPSLSPPIAASSESQPRSPDDPSLATSLYWGGRQYMGIIYCHKKSEWFKKSVLLKIDENGEYTFWVLLNMGYHCSNYCDVLAIPGFHQIEEFFSLKVP